MLSHADLMNNAATAQIKLLISVAHRSAGRDASGSAGLWISRAPR